MIVLDYRDQRPIYEQITEKIKDLLLFGVLKEDEQLPSVRSLAAELAINPNTIQRAYAELERQGYAYTVKGRGSFAAGREQLLEKRRTEIKEEIRKSLKEAAALGVDPAELSGLLEELRMEAEQTALAGRESGRKENTNYA